MPAIQVSRTDTFEQQRQKINSLGSTLFSISAGGSDLSTGNLKLGDGSVGIPSLAFVTDASLGLYKSDAQTIGFVSSNKKVLDISSNALTLYKNIILQKKTLTTSGTVIVNTGSNYDPGTYNDLSITGGTGIDAKANITVLSFTGEIFNSGTGYQSGSFASIKFLGGSGTGVDASITISGLVGEITSVGSGYEGGLYQNVPLTGGSGSGATANLTVGGSLAGSLAGTIISVEITNSGANYIANDILSASNTNLGGTGTGFQYKVTSDPGKVTEVTFTSRGSGYTVNDILSLPGSISNISSVLKGIKENVSTTLSTSSSTITVSSNTGIVAGMNVIATPDSTGSLAPQTTVLSVSGSNQVILSANPGASGQAVLTFTSPGNVSDISVASVQGIGINSIVTVQSGVGQLSSNTTVSAVNSQTNTITLSSNPTLAGSVVLQFTPAYGVPSVNFQYKILKIGAINTYSISDGGNGYSLNDILSISANDITQPIVLKVKNTPLQRVTFTGTVASSSMSIGSTIVYSGGAGTVTSVIYKTTILGGNIVSILIDSINLASGNVVTIQGSPTTYTVNTASSALNRYFIDSGSGTFAITPNLTLYSGNKYEFDLSDSSNSGHTFLLSKFRDGPYSPSLVEGITTTLAASPNIVVSSTTGIIAGMTVTVSSGNGALGLGTTVLSVDTSTSTITLSVSPGTPGNAVLKFVGVEYTDGVVKSNNKLTLTVTDATPSLYYYCSIHPNMGGDDNDEGQLTVNLINPKIFGTGLSFTVNELSANDIIFGDINTGKFEALSFVADEAIFQSTEITGTLTAPTISSQTITASTLSSPTTLTLSGTSINVSGNFTVGSNVQISTLTGNIETSGVLKTSGQLNVNDILSINNEIISVVSGKNITLTPASTNLVKIDSSTALIIPAGTSLQRPTILSEDGAIRFNTSTQQYEGYSETNSTWSSLGGVRDLDGNTYILAEATVGANDNTLYLVNDDITTVKFSPTYQEFVNVKKIRSINVSAPSYTTWNSNIPVTVGQYLKYGNNIYIVVTGGVTGTSGSEPTNTTGSNFPNGTAVLAWSVTAVAPLTFEEISELRIAPTGGTPLSINGDLRLSTNVISTDINDLIVQPNSGKKVIIDAQSSLVIPVGNTNARGAALQGSIRFNTTISQYEGYDGINWSSLGGVRDVDGNTYIIPELTAGGNQNILYFYNNGSNTLQLNSNKLEFHSIDTIESVTSGTLNLDANLITFNSLSASIDTSSATRTLISTTKDNLDFGLSSGLNNDPLVRLTDTGELFYNIAFGTGTFSGIKVFNSTLKDFELSDYKLSTTRVTLTRGTTNSDSVVLYSPALHSASKVQIVAKNVTTGDSEFIEYSVIDKGNDIFYTEFGNIKTGLELFSCTFDFNESNSVRVTFTINSALLAGTAIQFTVINNIIKR